MRGAVRGSGEDRPVRARRSSLAVPGSSERMLEKAQTLASDQFFIDLEDSVAPAAKESARDNAVQSLNEGDWGLRIRVVRVNGCATRWILRDVERVVSGAGANLDAIMVPKVQRPGQVEFVDLLLTQLELENDLEVGRIGLELQIEDADGLVNIGPILAASRRTEAVVLGPGDMAASLGMPTLTVGGRIDGHAGDAWHWIRSSILIHARAAGVQAIDGPYGNIRDLDGFRASALAARALGLDGKWVLHPDQIGPANEIFSVSEATFRRASDILAAYEHATETTGTGAVMFGDEMIDEASRRMAEANLARGRAQGLVIPPSSDDSSATPSERPR